LLRAWSEPGVHVALGHSMATYAQTRLALKEGVTGFTHLFNAMRPLARREPGPVAAALETPGAWFGMIVDGTHVDPAMLRWLCGEGHPILVTDAMPPVGGRQSTFILGGQQITVQNGACVRDDGALAGTALSMGEGGAKLRARARCAPYIGVALRFPRTSELSWSGRLAGPTQTPVQS